MDLVVSFVKECHDLRTVASTGRVEMGCICSRCDTILHCPQNRLVEEIRTLYIYKGVLVGLGFR